MMFNIDVFQELTISTCNILIQTLVHVHVCHEPEKLLRLFQELEITFINIHNIEMLPSGI